MTTASNGVAPKSLAHRHRRDGRAGQCPRDRRPALRGGEEAAALGGAAQGLRGQKRAGDAEGASWVGEELHLGRVQHLVKYWSNTGQTLVKHW